MIPASHFQRGRTHASAIAPDPFGAGRDRSRGSSLAFQPDASARRENLFARAKRRARKAAAAILFSLALCLLAARFSPCAAPVALAADEFRIISIECATSDGTALELESSDASGILEIPEFVYDGGVRSLTVRANCALDAKFEWYKGDSPSSAMRLVSTETDVESSSIALRDATDCGHYRCVVAKTSGPDKTPRETPVIKATILPRPVSVLSIVPEGGFVYDGEIQRPRLELGGDWDGANAVLDCDAGAFEAALALDRQPIDAGAYRGDVAFKPVPANSRAAAHRNYAWDGFVPAGKASPDSFEIKKAALAVGLKELDVLSGDAYVLKLEYSGLRGSDTVESLEADEGFAPVIPQEAFGLTEVGSRAFVCSGPANLKNYAVEYVEGIVHVDSPFLDSSSVSGCDATASGAFRAGTALTVDANSPIKPKRFNRLMPIRHSLGIGVASGKALGDSMVVSFAGLDLKGPFTSVCIAYSDGTTKKVSDFSASGGILRVAVPTSGDFAVTVYSNYVLPVALGAALFATIQILALVLARSRRKYLRTLARVNVARHLARERERMLDR